MRTRLAACVIPVLIVITYCALGQETRNSRNSPSRVRLDGDSLLVDSRFNAILQKCWAEPHSDRCIWEVYVYPENRDVSLIAVRRVPFVKEYARYQDPLVRFSMNGKLVFVYSGIDAYLKRHSPRRVNLPEGDWKRSPRFFKMFIDSLGIIKETERFPEYLAFPLVGIPSEEPPIPIADTSEAK